MKKLIFLVSALLFCAVFYSCEEEYVGQPGTDSVAPGPVKNPVAESLPGGARISYELPNDKDLLYVKAIYTVNGVAKNATSTLYTKSLEILGYGTTDEQDVTLYAVDRSGNQSSPVSIKIRPGTPPVKLIRESMQMERGFGGVQLTWRNETKADIVVYILAADSTNKLDVADVVYTNSVDEKYSLRGFDTTERVFGVYIRDRWDNFSDTLSSRFIPLFEEKLDKQIWRRQLFPGDNNTNSSWGPWDRIRDDIVGNQAWESNTGMSPILFTVDLGQTAKLSRYALWHRGGNDWEFRHYNPKRWKVYGSNDPKFAELSEAYWRVEEGGWKDDWILLADCYSFKPTGENNPITQEDRDYANRGFETEFSLDTPPVRFIRFHVTETWGGGNMVHVSELSFWGEPVK